MHARPTGVHGTRRLTALRPDSRVPGNLIVELDGARMASVPGDLLAQLELREGAELDSAAYARLATVAAEEAAYRVSLKLLAARPRSVAEVARKLRLKGHDAAAIDAVVRRLEARGLLQDDEFARHFARVRSGRGHGPHRICTDLLARGVARSVADRAIAEVLDDTGVDVGDQARALAVRRAAQLGGIPPDAKLRRLLGYLARRGFRGRDVTDMVKEVLESDAE